MSDVKRYDLEQPDSHMGMAKMQEEQYGDWVSFEDYTALRARLDAVEKKLDEQSALASVRQARAERAEAALATAREALTPSGETKAAYIGEFSFPQIITDEDGEERTVKVFVPWDTIKQIMAAIRIRALADEAPE